MTVYVDDMHLTDLGRYVRMRMCHMLADTTDELVEMARRIGVNPKWIQKAGTEREHFDIATSKRALAVATGAIEITMKQAAAMCAHRREFGLLGEPNAAMSWFLCRVEARALDRVEK